MRSRWLSCLLLVTAAACGGGEEDTGVLPGSPGGGIGGGPGGTTGLVVDSGTVVTSPGGPGASPGSTPGGTPGSGGPGAITNPTPGAGGNAGGPATMPWCEVEKILKDKCQTCHSDPVVGAPMPLVTWAHLQAASTAKPGEKIWQRVKARINDAAMPMPPAARPQLTAAEKAALNTYFSSSPAQPTGTCGTVTPTPGGMAGTAGGGTTGGGTMGGAPECDVTMELRAHAGSTPNDTTPYNVTKSGDSYEIFWYAPSWNEKMQAIAIDPIIDNGAILHHWLLYMKEKGTEAPGSHNPDSGLQSSDSALLSGWAPGNKSFNFGGMDVGMQVVYGPNARFGIEIHYNTSSNPPNRKDRSGARLCMTKKLRPKEAATHWLGTQAIIGFGGKFDANGQCTVMKESHIIAHSPHMHKTGRYMKSIISKKDGSKVKITDQPFAFDDQQIYPVDSPTGEIVVGPGDIINTTCSFDSAGPITFGPGTDSEMCYNFVVAWPVGSLSNGTPGLVGGKNTCIDGI